MLSLLLGHRAPAWDLPAPAAFPRRSLEWYLDRALAREAAWQPAPVRSADWELLDRNAHPV